MKSTTKTPATGNRTIPLLTVLVVFAVIGTIVAFAALSRVERHGEQYLQRVSEQQVLSQKVAKYALEAAAGDQASFERLRVNRDRFITLMEELKNGAVDADLPASPASMSEPLRNVENRWLALRAHADEILVNQNGILSIREFVDVINKAVPHLQQISDEVALNLIRSKADQQQVYIATRQLMLAQRLRDNVSRVLSGGTQTAAAIDQFSQDTERFGRVLNGMLSGDSGLNVARVTNAQAKARLTEADALFRSINDHVAEIIEMAPGVLPAMQAIGDRPIRPHPRLPRAKGTGPPANVTARFRGSLVRTSRHCDSRRSRYAALPLETSGRAATVRMGASPKSANQRRTASTRSVVGSSAWP